ncbi:MAG: discoidin domain-containing protein [Victivallales bacterium]
MRIFLFLSLSLCFVLHLPAANIALNRPYTLDPAPNYALCTNETDLTDLTDGKNCESKTPLWAQPGCVGWNHVTVPIKVTIDLGKSQVVSQIRFSTGGNISGVQYPDSIDVEVSNDGRRFYRLGSLTDMCKAKLPPSDYGYKPVIFEAGFPPVSARYVRLRGMANGMYYFCDEIEIHSTVKQPAAIETLSEAVSDDNFASLASGALIERYSKLRMLKTWDEFSARLKSKGRTASYAAELARIRTSIKEFAYRGNPLEFSSAVPLGLPDCQLYTLNARLLRELGYPELSVWTADAYTDISPLAFPPKNSNPGIQMHMMNNESRGAVLNLTSSADRELVLTVDSGNLPVKLYEVVYLDNAAMRLSSTALMPLNSDLRLPPGFTKQLYIQFHPQELPVGRHEGRLIVNRTSSAALEIPVQLTISPVRFPDKPRLNGGLWDYLDFRSKDGKSRGLYGDQAEFARRDQQEHLMDSTFAGLYRSRGRCGENLAEWNIGILPGLDNMRVAADGSLLTRLDFSDFDRWTSAWPDAAHYLIFLGARADSKFGGAAPGTPRFDRAVAEFAAQWDAHLEAEGIDHRRVVFHLLDEPRDKATYEASKHWMKAFKNGSRRIPVYSNPNKFMPEFKEGMKDADILSPHIELLIGGDKQSAEFFRSRAAAGQKLWVYSCDEGPFSTAPWYFRRQPWVAFAFGATGSFFWAYCDSSGIPNALNQYLSDKIYFSPVLIQRNRITGTKHFEALREGVEDYEYLCILRDLIDAKTDLPSAANAKRLLQEAVSQISAQQKSALNGKSDPAGFWRNKILQAIDELVRMQ